MGSPEAPRPQGQGEQPAAEILHPDHFYAAYIFDQAAQRREDLEKLITQATVHGYPVRYWWLSET
ncbi:MAG: hypothetical protein GY792_29530, partial [Gammaproteobacteria bacterium]|nr:hypothetical protein [Gammaproteobacteria bacterium]